MRAEDAAVHVRLVHDDVAEVREQVAPAVVMRQDADVQHVRVREDEVRPAADLPAALARRVAVVDRGAGTRQLEGGERARLILRQRFRRVEVERAQLRVARDRVEDGQVEGERLSRRCSRRDDDVLAALCGVPRLALVRVERVERQGFADARVEVVGERRERALRAGSVARCAISSLSSRSFQRASSTVTSSIVAAPARCPGEPWQGSDPSHGRKSQERDNSQRSPRAGAWIAVTSAGCLVPRDFRLPAACSTSRLAARPADRSCRTTRRGRRVSSSSSERARDIAGTATCIA